MAHRIETGRIWSDVLEIPVTSHCNLACRACDHLSPVAPKSNLEPGVLERDLALLAKCYHARTLKLIGGEPLLNPRIIDIAKIARHSGIADRISLVTNGVLAQRAPKKLWTLIDFAEVSAYPGYFRDDASLSALRANFSKWNVPVLIRIIDRFRESYSDVPAVESDVVRRIYQTCQIAHRWGCQNMHNGYFYKCSRAYTIPEYNGHRFPGAETDRVKLDAPDLFDRMREYLQRREPLAACAHCLGSAGKLIRHEMLVRLEWRRPQERPLEELLDAEFLQKLEVDPDAVWGTVENHICDNNRPTLRRRWSRLVNRRLSSARPLKSFIGRG